MNAVLYFIYNRAFFYDLIVQTLCKCSKCTN